MSWSLLSGRVAVVTGGASGIGLASCRALLGAGASVVVADVSQKSIDRALVDLGGDAIELGADATPSGADRLRGCRTDVSQKADVEALFEDASRSMGAAPSILVNCAGITRDGWMAKMSEEAFDDVSAVNLKGTWLTNQAFARHYMAAREESGVVVGGRPGGAAPGAPGPLLEAGSIINISSLVGKSGNMGQTNYAATKAGVVGLSKSAAKELAHMNVRVNAVLPGFIETPMADAVPEKVMDHMLTQIPMGRLGTADEVGELVLFLASGRSSYITGTAIEISGGMWM